MFLFLSPECGQGVPQGSTLEPLLLSISVHNLPQICSNCHVDLYAVDRDTNILTQLDIHFAGGSNPVKVNKVKCLGFDPWLSKENVCLGSFYCSLLHFRPEKNQLIVPVVDFCHVSRF